jgi:hypothetical protein
MMPLYPVINKVFSIDCLVDDGTSKNQKQEIKNQKQPTTFTILCAFFKVSTFELIGSNKEKLHFPSPSGRIRRTKPETRKSIVSF